MRGVPLAGEALGFSNLFGGHFGGVDVSVLDPPVAILARRLGGGEVSPHVRLHAVLRDAAAVVIPEPMLTPAATKARLSVSDDSRY